MTTLREAAQQALEALNRSDYLGWQFNIPIIKALRAALAEPDYWEEEARRYASNADYWRKRCVSCGGALPATGQDDRTGECVCGEPAPQGPTPPPEAQTEAEKIAYCAGWWDALAKARKAEPTPLEDVVTHGSAWSKNGKRIDPMSVYAEPVQDGCDHCNHPLYAAVKCRVCGRVTSQQ